MYVDSSMNIRNVLITSFLIVLLLFPVVSGTDIELVEKKEMAPIIRIVGLFPKVHDDSITCLSLPSFRWTTIPQENFRGHIGIFLLVGYYIPYT